MERIQDSSKRYARVFDQQMSTYEWYARKHGLQGKSLQILLWLYYNPQGLSQKVMVERTQSTKQVINATIKSWIAKDYIEMAEGPVDKRQKLVALSPRGRDWAAGFLAPLEKAEQAAMEGFSDQEQEQLIRLVDRYSKALREKLEEI